MKTIQMTIDESLLQQVDETVHDLNTTRSAFIRLALEEALKQYRVRQLEERDAAGYSVIPVNDAEMGEWSSEQVWGDEWNAAK